MERITKIMVCVDLSEYSRRTIEYAAELATGFKTELVFLTVLNKRDVDAVELAGRYYPEVVNLERYLEKARMDRVAKVEELIEQVLPDTKISKQIRFRTGIPYEEILKAIDEENVDMVVLGNKGKTNLSRTLLGSNAEKVFRHSPVPVLSVRSREGFGRKV